MPKKNNKYNIGQTIWLRHGDKSMSGVVLECEQTGPKNFSYKILTEKLKLVTRKQAKLFSSKEKIQKRYPPRLKKLYYINIQTIDVSFVEKKNSKFKKSK